MPATLPLLAPSTPTARTRCAPTAAPASCRVRRRIACTAWAAWAQPPGRTPRAQRVGRCGCSCLPVPMAIRVLLPASPAPCQAGVHHACHADALLDFFTPVLPPSWPCPRADWAAGGSEEEAHWGLYAGYYANDTEWVNTFVQVRAPLRAPPTPHPLPPQVTQTCTHAPSIHRTTASTLRFVPVPAPCVGPWAVPAPRRPGSGPGRPQQNLCNAGATPSSAAATGGRQGTAAAWPRPAAGAHADSACFTPSLCAQAGFDGTAPWTAIDAQAQASIAAQRNTTTARPALCPPR